MTATTVTTRAIKGSALTHNEMDANFNNLNNVGIYVGTVVAWLTSTVPDSTWRECTGESVTIAAYPDLFARIGYTFGGAGPNFSLPDFRGQFLRGWDHGAGNDPDAASRTNRGDGTTGDNVGTKQADGVGPHTHPLPYGSLGNTAGSPGQLSPVSSNPESTPVNTGNETRPKNVNVMWIIKARLS